jgi:hypothetical protein
MTINTTVPRSRRTLLAGGIGGLVALAAAAVGRPLSVRGSDGEQVLVGGEYTATSVTKFDTGSTGETGVWGNSDRNWGLRGTNTWDAAGGVLGESVQSIGVVAQSQYGTGLLGHSGDWEPAFVVSPRAKTGVWGHAEQDATAVGVQGESTLGCGIRGEATTGVGVCATATTGTALQVLGKAKLSRSGRVAVLAGKAYVDVDLTKNGGLGGTPLCFANLLYYRSGVFVAAVRPNYPSTGKLRIYLSKAVAGSTNVAWVVLG